MDQFNQDKKIKKQLSNEPIKLNQIARARFLEDMFYQVNNKQKMSPDYLILVLDKSSSKIISNFCSVFDLMKHGNVYQMELIHLPRKRYPMSDVLYFLQPTKENIDLLMKDFQEEDKFDFDQYGIVHLCFTTAVPKNLFERLAQCKKLLSKIRTFLEINVNFQVWQENIFKTPLKLQRLQKILSQDSSSPLIQNLAEQIYTLCSACNERPYIQYQGESDICEQVASAVYNKLEQLYNRGQLDKKKGQEEKQLEYREPRGILLITDRTLDLVSPLIHDYHYQSAVFDYLKVGEDGCLEKIIPQQKSKQQQAASENTHYINEEDMIWNKYKYIHLAEVHAYLQDEIKQLREQQLHIKKLSQKQDLHHDDIKNMLQNIPEFEQKTANVLIHYDLIQKITNYVSNERLQLMRLIELEQTIISGLSDQGKEVSETTIGKELIKITKSLPHQEDVLRLLAIYISCYNLPESDFVTCQKMVSSRGEAEVLKVIRGLKGNLNPKKIQRFRPVLSQQDFQDYKRKYVNEIQEQYDILRSQPTIVKLVKDIINKTVDQRQFPFIGPAPDDLHSHRKDQWRRVGDEDQDGRLIVFMIGGISHYEICSLNNLEKQYGSSRLIIGSNHILTARKYLETLGNVQTTQVSRVGSDVDEESLQASGKKQKPSRINDSDHEQEEEKGYMQYQPQQNKQNLKKRGKQGEIEMTFDDKNKPKNRNIMGSNELFGQDVDMKKSPQKQRTKPRGILDIEEDYEQKEGKKNKRRLDKESDEVTENSMNRI